MIWLIGNKGMLGTEIETLLREQHMDYIATDLDVDITNPDSLQEFAAQKPIAWIINCAAYTVVDRAEDEPERAFLINADGPQNLARLAAARGAKLIHISTDYVFDGANVAPYVETDHPNPLGAYALSKYRGEQHVMSLLDEHFIIRSAWMYGNNGPNFVKTMLRLFQEKDEVGVVDDQWGSPTYAPDLAAAVMTIIAAGSTAYGIYHFTNEGRINWYQFACAIYDLAGKQGLLTKSVRIVPITTAQYPTKAKRPRYAYLSKEKICRTFHMALIPWEVSLATYLSMMGKPPNLP